MMNFEDLGRSMLEYIALGVACVAVWFALGVQKALIRQVEALHAEKEDIEKRLQEKVEDSMISIKEVFEETVEDVDESFHPEDAMEMMKAQMMGQVYALIMNLIQRRFGGPDFAPTEIEQGNNEAPPLHEA